MGNLIATVPGAVVLPRIGERIERRAHGPVADRVHVNRESGRIGAAHDPVQVVLREIRGPAIVRGVAVPIEVGLEEGGGLRGVFDDAVGEDLDGVRAQEVRVDRPA